MSTTTCPPFHQPHKPTADATCAATRPSGHIRRTFPCKCKDSAVLRLYPTTMLLGRLDSIRVHSGASVASQEERCDHSPRPGGAARKPHISETTDGARDRAQPPNRPRSSPAHLPAPPFPYHPVPRR